MSDKITQEEFDANMARALQESKDGNTMDLGSFSNLVETDPDLRTDWEVEGIRVQGLEDRITELESERDGLTAKIDAAQHGYDCDSLDIGDGPRGDCTCWKASTGDDALRHVKAQAVRDAADTLKGWYANGDVDPIGALGYLAKQIEAGE